MRKYRDALKVQKVIDSCVTIEQAKVAECMAYNYSKMYDTEDLSLYAFYKALESGNFNDI